MKAIRYLHRANELARLAILVAQGHIDGDDVAAKIREALSELHNRLTGAQKVVVESGSEQPEQLTG